MLRTFIKERIPRAIRRAIRDLWKEIEIGRLHRASVRRARTLSFGGAPPRLNLASGFRPKQGADWINVDLSDQADLQLDLREPLPFPDDSVAEIYTEHFLEHLDYPNLDDSSGWDLEAPARPSDALGFLRECRRVLRPGGVLDVVVPDAECILQEYVARRDQPCPRYGWWGPKWCTTPLHCVNYVFRQGREHKYAYDEETLGAALAAAGFDQVARRSFDPSVDADNHEIGSLCMRASKRADSGLRGGAGLAPCLSSSAA